MQILALKGVRDSSTTYHESINLNKETEGCGSNRSSRENSSDILRLNVSSSTRLSTIGQEHEHLQHRDHQQHQNPTSRQLFPSGGFDSMFGGISNDHQSGLWPWLQQQQQHLGWNQSERLSSFSSSTDYIYSTYFATIVHPLLLFFLSYFFSDSPSSWIGNFLIFLSFAMEGYVQIVMTYWIKYIIVVVALNCESTIPRLTVVRSTTTFDLMEEGKHKLPD